MSNKIDAYLCNLFAFPFGYFEEHTAEELNLTEEDRQELIKLQNEAKERKRVCDRQEDLRCGGRPTKRKLIAFHKDDEILGFLSNWYPSKFEIDWVRYSSVEQYIMYQKAQLFHDSKTADKILSVNDPAEIKHLGRSVRPYVDSVWCGKRQFILYEGLMEKFSQNSTLRNKLMGTMDSVLAECVESDSLWSIGLSMNDERRLDILKWRGQNLLGYTLMEVREKLAKQ